MKNGKVRLAVIGMNFGLEFAEIFRCHPEVAYVGVCDANSERLQNAAAKGFDRQHTDFRDVLASPDYDAVHICLPVTMHVAPTLQALQAGKHVACAVPMATSLDDLHAIVAAQRASGKNYMMMETEAYSHETFYVQDLLRQGVLGDIQFIRGAHYQDLENLNPVWNGLPPMYYITHALAPALVLTGKRVSRVNCLGSGRMRESFRQAYGNPYPIETAIMRLADSDIAVEITRTMIETAVEYQESFSVYGDKATFLWNGVANHRHAVITLDPISDSFGRACRMEEAKPVYRPDLLPSAVQPFAGGVHGGSHPHLVHEFIRSIVEERPPRIDAVTAAQWCAPGICAHESAMRGGESIEVPAFT